jgi:hypothetical protein
MYCYDSTNWGVSNSWKMLLIHAEKKTAMAISVMNAHFQRMIGLYVQTLIYGKDHQEIHTLNNVVCRLASLKLKA